MRSLFIVFMLALPVHAGLQVGFAERDVTPKLSPETPVYIAGFGHNRKATAVLDPIMARAMVLSDGADKIAIVSVDVIGLFHPFVESVRAKLPGFKYVLITSTHNHDGPDTLGLWGMSPLHRGVDDTYMDRLRDALIDVTKAADKASGPVSAYIQQVALPDLLADQRPPIVKHDTLTVVRFHRLGTFAVSGIWLTWNCHPETLGKANTKLSSDYVGYCVAALAKTHRCSVLYCTGTVGGLMTSLEVPIRDATGKLLADGTEAKTICYGEALADATTQALRGAKVVNLTPFDVRVKPLLLPVDNRLYRVGRELKVLQRTMYRFEPTADPLLAKPVDDTRPPVALRTEIGRLTLGELGIAIIPGEIYPELVLGKVADPAPEGADFPDAAIEPAIFTHTPGKYKMTIGLGNDEIGYILPKRQWDAQPPYTYGLKSAPYGEINSLGPETGPLICEAYRALGK